MRRRRHLLVLTIAFSVVLGFEATVRMLEPRLGPPLVWPTAAIQVKVEQISQLGPVDAVLLGTSAVAQGVNPETVTDLSQMIDDAYNAAFPFGRGEVLPVFFREIVEPHLDPEVVIIELLPQENLPALADGFFDAFVSSVGYRSLTDTPWEGAVGRISAIVRNRATLQDPVEALARFSAKGTDDLGIRDSGQYVPPDLAQRYHFSDEYRLFLAQHAKAVRHPDAEPRLDDLVRLIADVQQAGADPILLIMPIYEAEYFAVVPVQPLWAELLANIEAMAERRGIPLIDPTELSWTIDDFTDPLHLNRHGAERLSRWLGIELDRVLTDPESS